MAEGEGDFYNKNEFLVVNNANVVQLTVLTRVNHASTNSQLNCWTCLSVGLSSAAPRREERARVVELEMRQLN